MACHVWRIALSSLCQYDSGQEPIFAARWPMRGACPTMEGAGTAGSHNAP